MRWFYSFALAFALAVGLAQTAPAQEAAPKSTLDPNGNAAMQYWQAFSFMPNLDEGQSQLLQDINNLEEWHKLPLNPEAQKLVEASRTSLMYLHRGAQLKKCDWGLDYGDGIGMLMPHLAKCRDLVRLAALRARIEMERGNWKAARGDLTAIMVLARHVRSESTMLSVLVGLGLENVAVDLIAPYVPDLKAPYAQAVAHYEALPDGAVLAQSIRFEKDHMVRWMIRKLREEEARQPGAGLVLFKNFLGDTDVPDALKQLKSVDEIVAMIEKLLPIYDDLVRLVALPNDKFAAEFPAFKAKVKAENALAGTLLPSIDMIRAKEQRGQTRLAMLLAAIAIAEGGPGKVAESKDPFGNGPFEYKALDQGFELVSKLQYEGQPVKLVVGQRKK